MPSSDRTDRSPRVGDADDARSGTASGQSVAEIRDRLAATGGFRQLPPPVPRDQMVATSEASRVPEEKDDYWREVEWMLRVSGLV